MGTIRIPGTEIVASRLFFGTASLLNAGSAATRQAILDCAVDNGFTHFDTAPYYGFGTAERDLAPLLARHPQLTVTTKVGLYSPGGETQSVPLILMRKAAGRLLPAISRPTIDWHLARARKSLEDSLRRLRRDHVDIYMLHEPILSQLNSEEWLRWLERCVSSGRVRSFGLALTSDQLEPFLLANDRLADLVQTYDSLEDKEADILARFGRPFQITCGYVSAAKARNSALSVPDILQGAMKRNPRGAIIVSTKRLDRVGVYAGLMREAA